MKKNVIEKEKLAKLEKLFDKEAECPKFDEFLEKILPDEKDRLSVYEWFGYSFWTNNYNIPQICLLIGSGANGKSTLLRVFEKLIGKENITTLSLSQLENNNFLIAELQNKKANITYALKSQYLKDSYIKMIKILVSGDFILADRKYKNPISFINTAKLFISTNQSFTINPDYLNHSLMKRFSVLKFSITIPEKQRKDSKILLKQLLTKNEISGINKKSFEGLKRLHENKEFSNVKSEYELMEEWKKIVRI